MATKKTPVKNPPKPKGKPKETPKTETPKSTFNVKINEPSQQEVQSIANSQNEAALSAGEALANRLNDPNAFGKVRTERTQEELDSLNTLKNEYDSARTRSADSQLAIDRMRAGLEGLNSQEGMALRETARRELDNQFQNQMALSRANAARSGTRGAAAGAQSAILMRQRAKEQGNLEQGLAVQNYNIKQQALQNFGNFNASLEQQEAARRQAAANSLTSQQNILGGRDLDRETFNLNQDTNRAINRNQTVLGGAGIQAGLAANAYANQLGVQNTNANLQIAAEQMRQAQQGLDIYGRSMNNMYPDRSGGGSSNSGKGDGRTRPKTVNPNPNKPKTTTRMAY